MAEPSRRRRVLVGLAGLLAAPLGPALVALWPWEAPPGALPVGCAWALTLVALGSAAFQLVRALGANRLTTGVLVAIVGTPLILLGSTLLLARAWSAGAQGALERRWVAAVSAGSLAALESAVGLEQESLREFARASSSLGLGRAWLDGHEPLLAERQAWEAARAAPDLGDWRWYEGRARDAQARVRHGHHQEELAAIAGRRGQVPARLAELRAAGASFLRARLGAPGVDPAGAELLAAVVAGELPAQEDVADQLRVDLRDDLGATGPGGVVPPRERALRALERITAACLRNRRLLRLVEDGAPPVLIVELRALSPLEVEAAAPRSTRSHDLELRASLDPGPLSLRPAWRRTTTLRVEVASGEPLAEAGWLAAAHWVATALGLDCERE